MNNGPHLFLYPPGEFGVCVQGNTKGKKKPPRQRYPCRKTTEQFRRIYRVDQPGEE